MSKPLASLHAGLVTRVLPRPSPHPRPPVMPVLPTASREAATGTARPSATVTPLRPWLRPRMMALRPAQIEMMPAPVSESTPLPAPRPDRTGGPKRRATTLRLGPRLYARLRVAREELGRSGQSILVEALDDWLRKHETAD